MFNTHCFLKPFDFLFEKYRLADRNEKKNAEEIFVLTSFRPIFSFFQKKSPFSIFVESKRHVQSLRGSVPLFMPWGST